MNPFKPDAGKKLERDLDAARLNRDKLTDRLKLAESAVADSRAVAQRLARDGADDDALDPAEAALRAQQDRVVTLTAALAELNQQVARLESESADFADKKLRSETAAAIDALAEDITKAGFAFDKGLAVLADATCRAAAIALDAKGLEAFTVNVRNEVPATVTMIAGVLRARARATIAGTAPANLPQAAPAPIPTPPPPPTERLFMLRHAKYRDDVGLHLIPRFSDADLPLVVAARALAVGAAVPLNDPRRKRLGSQGRPRPLLEWCEDLDAEIAADRAGVPVSEQQRAVAS